MIRTAWEKNDIPFFRIYGEIRIVQFEDARFLSRFVARVNIVNKAEFLRRKSQFVVHIVVDMVVPAPNEPHLSKIADIEMLVATPRGRERTEEEFRKLFEAAEVQFSGITPTAGHISIIEARP